MQENPDKKIEDLLAEMSPQQEKQPTSPHNNHNASNKKEKPPEKTVLHKEFDEVFKKQDVELLDYTVFKVFMLIVELLMSYWEPFCYLNLLLYHIIENGWLTTVIPILIFGYALAEETRPRFVFWKIMFYFLTLVILIKFIITLSASQFSSDVTIFHLIY